MSGIAGADAHRCHRRVQVGIADRRASDLRGARRSVTDRAMSNDDFSARWTGQARSTRLPGDYELTVTGDDGFRLWVDGNAVIDEWTTDVESPRAQRATSTSRPARPYGLKAGMTSKPSATPRSGLSWQLPGAPGHRWTRRSDARARRRRRSSSSAGLTGDVEGEEMQVSFPASPAAIAPISCLPVAAGTAARGAARHGQARRAGADDRIGALGGVGAGAPAGDPRGLVSGSARRQRDCRRAVRRCESRRAAARDVLPLGAAASAVCRLRHEGTDRTLLHRRAAAPVRLRCSLPTPGSITATCRRPPARRARRMRSRCRWR